MRVIRSQEKRNPHLTAAMARILTLMREDRNDPDGYGGELVNEKRSWVVGVDRVSGPAAIQLLQICALRECDYGADGVIHYELCVEGERLLDDPLCVPAIVAMRQRGASRVFISSDGSQRFE